MKRIVFVLAALLMIVSAVPVSAAGGGNGLDVNGPHYNLNIHGAPKAKTADMTGSDGHSIFVPENGTAKIMLSPGDFQVLDANGTDGSAAFQLPVPGDCYGTVDSVTGDVTTPSTCTVKYQVWIRALGKPGGKANMYTCATDPTTLETLCSDPTWWVTVTRSKGKSTFTNVSKELLFVSTDVDGDSTVEHVMLFDPILTDYYWNYDNYGLKLAQLRFYPVAQTIDW